MKNLNYKIPLRKIKLPDHFELVKYLKKIDTERTYSNYGPLVQILEKSLAEKFKTDPQNVIITCNCTSSLQSILLRIKNKIKHSSSTSLNKEEKFYCIVPSFTFAASAMAIIGSGLKPIFLDIDKNSAQLTPNIVENFFKKKIIDIKNIVAVMPVSPFGVKIKKNDWIKFYKTYKLDIVYDEAWCFDTFSKNKIGDSAISLHVTKSFGCGEGGLIITNDNIKATEFRKIINFGFDTKKRLGLIGFNGKMTEYNAAVALRTLEQWPENKFKCLELQKYYLYKLEKFSKIKVLNGFDKTFAWGTLPLIFEKKKNIKKIISIAALKKIEFRAWWKHGVQKFEAMNKFPSYKLDNTISLTNRLINVPFYPEMSHKDIDQVCSVLKKFDS